MPKVYFGTNRNPIPLYSPENQSCVTPEQFGPHLNDRGMQLRFGSAQISENLEEVESVSTKRENLRTEPELQKLGSIKVFKKIRQSMREGIDTVLFIHGFNYNFHEALIDTARLKRLYEKGQDRPYTFIVFSWPSDGSMRPFLAYANDRAMRGPLARH